ncbi:Ig domain-containing protein [Bacillus sp. PAMC26568]|nr:Ig domain-containing protein [Bacillus sp. PAMC26568]
MFNYDDTDIQFLLDQAGREVLVNDSPRQALITNPAISEQEERYIHTLERVCRGDTVEFDNVGYICITESITKRNGKYKALIRHCNYPLELPGEEVCVIVGENDFGDPLYECTNGESISIPAIVDNKSFSIDLGNAINVPNNQIIVTLQNNETNSDTFTLNYQFDVMESKWKVVNRDLSKNGLLILTCEFVTAS